MVEVSRDHHRKWFYSQVKRITTVTATVTHQLLWGIIIQFADTSSGCQDELRLLQGTASSNCSAHGCQSENGKASQSDLPRVSQLIQVFTFHGT